MKMVSDLHIFFFFAADPVKNHFTGFWTHFGVPAPLEDKRGDKKTGKALMYLSHQCFYLVERVNRTAVIVDLRIIRVVGCKPFLTAIQP